MHPINDVAAELNLSVEDIRLIISDEREDWTVCESLSDAEYQLIKQSKEAKEKGSNSIAALSGADMPIKTQEKLITSAAQILNTQLILAIDEEIALLDALEQAKNHIILQNHEIRRKELVEALSQDWTEAKQLYLNSLHSMEGLLIPDVDITPDKVDAKGEIGNILGKLQVKTWR